jgi:UDP-N-acetylmuramate--alanine ligase
VSYGFGERADVQVVNVERKGLQTEFAVAERSVRKLHRFTLNLPGAHNVTNALAAIAVANELGVSFDAVRAAFEKFAGIDRRLQRLGSVRTAVGQVTFVDDYGHHPTEIAATLAAARDAWPGRRVVAVFQPHRYTRTRDLLDDFARVLAGVDALVLTEVYSAGEDPITGADGKALARAVRARGAVEPVFIEDLRELPAVLGNIIRADDVVLTLGAGNIGAVAASLPKALTVRGPVGVKT